MACGLHPAGHIRSHSFETRIVVGGGYKMASPGELIRTLAAATGLPKTSLVVSDRRLLEAGLRSKSGRGRSAAKVTARDAAHLLVAILGTAQVRDAVLAVQRYRETRPQAQGSSEQGFTGIGIDELERLSPEHSFIDVLATLIASAADGSLAALMRANAEQIGGETIVAPPHIEIAALMPGTLGEIRITGTGTGISRSMRYALPDPWRDTGGQVPDPAALQAWEDKLQQYRVEGDFKQQRSVSENTIMRLAALLEPAKEK